MISFVLVSIPAFSELLRSANPGGLGLRLATGLFVGVCLVQCALVFKKRKQSRASMESSRIPEIPAPATPLTDHENGMTPMTLLLAQTEQQTHDTRTLRFQVLNEKRCCAKPGQFLTFQWTVDGQRVPRSYTISSSPIHENYVEITPKRMENGCASVFLNEQAKPGLRVEASGPYGQFYFDETLHKSIVLIAAGSGITPMISMLSYIDDLKLTHPVTLLYCVRTRADIIFQNELLRLRKSLPNFRYELCLSRPDPTWKGRSGRLTQEFVSQHVTDLNSPTFFLCGPKGFMDSARPDFVRLSASTRTGFFRRVLGKANGPRSLVQGKPAQSRPSCSFTRRRCVRLPPEPLCWNWQRKAGCGYHMAAGRAYAVPALRELVSGTVQMDVEAGLTVEQKKAGYVLPCVSRAKGTVVVAA